MRVTAVIEGEFQLYNEFMIASVKGAFKEGPYKNFWELIQLERVTLISSVEESTSSVTGGEAEAFLKSEPLSTATTQDTLGADDDDLFSSMA